MNIKNPNLDATNPKQIKVAMLKKRAALVSMCVASTLVISKFFAYIFTDSVSMMSSLMDSAFDLVASSLTMFSVCRSAIPADKEHKYGYGKIEAISAAGQAAFILASAGYLFVESMHRFVTPQKIQEIDFGIYVMLLSIVMTIGLVFYQYYIIKKTQSVAIKADHLHYKSDLLMNIAVIAAMWVTYHKGWPYFDPMFGTVIAFLLLHSAYEIFQEALGILMDREISDKDRRKIKKIVNSHSDVCDIHDLRTRNSGNQLFIEFHMEVDGELSVNTAHKITEELEHELYQAFPKSDVLIHQEPKGIDDRRIG